MNRKHRKKPPSTTPAPPPDPAPAAEPKDYAVCPFRPKRIFGKNEVTGNMESTTLFSACLGRRCMAYCGIADPEPGRTVPRADLDAFPPGTLCGRVRGRD